MKNDLLPRSWATNFWELCLEVIQTIRAVESRFNWSDWIQTMPEIINDRLEGEQPPACGTQACLGGWMWLLLNGDDRDFDQFELMALLPAGEIRTDLRLIFYGYDLLKDGPQPLTRQSSESQHKYVGRAVRQVELFMMRWERELKATAVTPSHR